MSFMLWKTNFLKNKNKVLEFPDSGAPVNSLCMDAEARKKNYKDQKKPIQQTTKSDFFLYFIPWRLYAEVNMTATNNAIPA